MYVRHIIPPERLNDPDPVRDDKPAYMTTALMRAAAFVEGRINPGGFKEGCYPEGRPVQALGSYDGSILPCLKCGWEWCDFLQVELNAQWHERQKASRSGRPAS